MFIKFNNLAHKYYNFWMNFLNLKNKVKIIPIDFNKHWSAIIWKQKRNLTYVIIAETIDNVFYTLIPILIGVVIETQNLNSFYTFIISWLVIILLEYSALYFSAIIQTQSIHSLLYYAHQFFLTVDPIYHSTRSSGKIVGKIDRGINSFEDLLDTMIFDILPTFVGVVTVMISFFKFDTKLFLIAFAMTTTMGLINIALQFLGTKAFESNVINAADKLNSISLENLTQVNFIRSCFASNEVNTSLYNNNLNMMYTNGTSWISFSAITLFTRISYVLSILILGSYIINLIITKQISIIIGTTLLMTYIGGSYEIMKLGRKVKKILKCVTRINDLFNFVKIFGKQTYPVLSSQTTSVRIPVIAKDKDALIINIDNLNFDYNPKTKIFDNHNLEIEINKTQKNKLYGIIGPSGIGKTTLISILGGQLNPPSGTIKVQDVDIYKVDDFTRKYLVALQGQVANSLRGTIRYNLLFGLPKNNTYNDTALIEVLESVGLWQLFTNKDGLETLIGENGLNLSGGQRQRLNFANLYLRAKFYSPALLLIDEPTSSLDEVSEKTITQMISELSESTITFVIAHRLNTLEQAVGILDFSLITKNKNITFYTKNDLFKISPYYQQLLKGEINFE